jgi:hypothetical protein
LIPLEEVLLEHLIAALGRTETVVDAAPKLALPQPVPIISRCKALTQSGYSKYWPAKGQWPFFSGRKGQLSGDNGDDLEVVPLALFGSLRRQQVPGCIARPSGRMIALPYRGSSPGVAFKAAMGPEEVLPRFMLSGESRPRLIFRSDVLSVGRKRGAASIRGWKR